MLDKFFPKPEKKEKEEVFNLQAKQPKLKKDKHSLVKSQNRMLFYIPYRYFVDEGQTLLLKNGGFMICHLLIIFRE